MSEQPKFHIGQTVYYPALILGHDSTVSICTVNLNFIDGTFYRVENKNWCHTRAEALAKLRAKLEKRIGYLTAALGAIK